jgi:hypothetical protein
MTTPEAFIVEEIKKAAAKTVGNAWDRFKTFYCGKGRKVCKKGKRLTRWRMTR